MTSKRPRRAVDCKKLPVTNNLKPGEQVVIDPKFFVACFGEYFRKRLLARKKEKLNK